jgi:L-ascorbate metabolism protein UlaG (beta-lactamase superfamily)
MKLTWYGHSAFRLEFGDKRVLIDPFLSGNPTWDGGWEGPAEGCTHVLLTHGHADHIGDSADILKKTGAQLVSSFEVYTYLAGKGVENANPGNHGGTVDCGGFTVSFVNALHSSSMQEDGRIIYLGNPMGLIVKAPGEPVLYHMGDTEIFSDMALINEIHGPEIGIVPIGDRFTMGAKTAAMACQRFFKLRTVVPCHYGTFPMIDPDAEKFKAEMGADAGKVLVPERGKTVAL